LVIFSKYIWSHWIQQPHVTSLMLLGYTLLEAKRKVVFRVMKYILILVLWRPMCICTYLENSGFSANKFLHM
jgi:hypothetical protein